jgi:23S rRNA pseudouridine1911/1915/1917 synthase
MSKSSPKLQVVLESPKWIIVNKRAGLITESNPFEHSLEDEVKAYLKTTNKVPFLGIVHRLDRVTSGLIIFAKKPSVLKALNKMMEHKSIKKTYQALTNHPLPQKKGRAEHYIFKDQKSKKALISVQKKEGYKLARLSYKLEQAKEQNLLYQIDLQTGRFHQIRAQFAYLGAPILGDTKYGGNPLDSEASLPTICLHANALKFPENDLDLPQQVSIAAPFL